MSKVSPAISLRIPRAIGKIERMLVTEEFLKSIFANPAYTFPGQRNHSKNLNKHKHTKGVLTGGSQQFAGVYVENLKQYFNIDGYHRAQSLITGQASIPAGHDIELTIHRVANLQDADALYDQFNSAAAAKRAMCYYESAERKSGHRFSSVWATKYGVVYGLQLAAGVRGTVATRDAVEKLFEGLKICDELQLPRTKHVTSGVKGALIAIAQYAQDKQLARHFIVAVCADRYIPLHEDLKARAVMAYVAKLKEGSFGGSGGGGAATNVIFEACLGVFLRYALYARGRKRVSESGCSIGDFIEQMKSLPAKAA